MFGGSKFFWVWTSFLSQALEQSCPGIDSDNFLQNPIKNTRNLIKRTTSHQTFWHFSNGVERRFWRFSNEGRRVGTNTDTSTNISPNADATKSYQENQSISQGDLVAGQTTKKQNQERQSFKAPSNPWGFGRSVPFQKPASPNAVRLDSHWARGRVEVRTDLEFFFHSVRFSSFFVCWCDFH